jgi:hypothetical protein
MKSQFRPIRIMMLALMVVAMALSSAAQLSSKPAQITIIAIMPENLTLNVNSGSRAQFTPANTAEVPGVVTGTTTAWSLARGRAKVTTLATVSYPNAPVMVADASAIGVRPGTDEIRTDAHPRHLGLFSKTTSTPVSTTSLTDANRRGTSTAEIPSSTSPSQSLQTPGTVKIQIQPVL